VRGVRDPVLLREPRALPALIPSEGGFAPLPNPSPQIDCGGVIRPHRVLALASLALAALGAAPAAAIEDRLRVANVRDEAFTSFLTSGELHDGATGPGLDRLESRHGRLPEGGPALRPLSPGRERVDRPQLSRSSVLDLAEGIGVTHGAEPATSTAVLAWRERYNDREAPGRGFLRIRLR